MASIHGGSGNELFYHGSTFLKGSGAKLDLSGSNSKYFICAITSLADTTAFTALEVLDNGVNIGLGDTFFASTDGPHRLDINWAGDDTYDTTAETNDGNSDQLATGDVVTAGVTIYGMYDKITLNAGSCIVYVAPRHDYMNRSSISLSS